MSQLPDLLDRCASDVRPGPEEEFPPAVAERLQAYVYLLRDPRDHAIFYVGKGRGDRVFAHLRAAREADSREAQVQTIREIRAHAMEPEVLVLRHGLTDEVALEIEAAVIDAFGLDALRNDVRGHGAFERGSITAFELMARYAPRPLRTDAPVLLVNLRQAFVHGMSTSELYEATRGHWRVNPARHAPEYALAVYDGIVRGVFRIEQWQRSTETSGRWIFTGSPAPDRHAWVGCDVSAIVVRGSQNPIRYLNC